MKNKPLKILFDAGPLVNGSKSGVGYYTYRVLDNLAAKYPDELEFRVHYFNFLGRRKNLELPRHPNITYVESRILPGKILNMLRRIGLQLPLELFFKSRGDVAVFPNFVSLPSIFRIPTFVAVHDLCYIDVPEFVAEQNRRFLTKFVPRSVKAAARVITISESTKRAIQKHYTTPDSKFVLTPIPPAAAHPVKPQRPEGLAGKFILFVSTLEPRKNVIGLVKGYEALPKKIRDTYALVLAGGMGWYMEQDIAYIQALQEKGYRIILSGYISDAEKEWLYNNATLFVMPSHYEGFGMPILEAMQHQLPTALSDIDVFHEVAGDASLYFDKESPASIARILEMALKDPALRELLVSKGNARLKNYSWDTVAATLKSELENI